MFYSLITICVLGLQCEQPREYQKEFMELQACVEYAQDRGERLYKALDMLDPKSAIRAQCLGPPPEKETEKRVTI